jgi:hypothetical protein
MTAYNIVRSRVKPGMDEKYLEAHRNVDRSGLAGFRHGVIVKTGDRSYCFIGEWDDYASIEKSRDAMVATLDTIREYLEDLGEGLGVTDPVSGEVVLEV